MGTYDGKEFCQPVACMSVRRNIPCPIVPWTERDVYALSSAQFVSLLHDLGLILASGLYPCIPSEWSAKILYDVAFLLGHIDPHKLDFDQSRLYTKPDEGISCDPIFDRSKGKFVDGQYNSKGSSQKDNEFINSFTLKLQSLVRTYGDLSRKLNRPSLCCLAILIVVCCSGWNSSRQTECACHLMKEKNPILVRLTSIDQPTRTDHSWNRFQWKKCLLTKK
jgi:hypothetical protein